MIGRPTLALMGAAALAGCATTSERTPYSGAQACAIDAVTTVTGSGQRYNVRNEADGSRTYAVGDEIAEGGIQTSEINVSRDGRVKLATRFHVSARTPHAASLQVTGDYVVSAERDYMGTTLAITVRPLQPQMTPLIEMGQVLTAANTNMLHNRFQVCMGSVTRNPELLRRQPG